MKTIFVILIALISLNSCSIIKKQKHKVKEHVETHIAVQKDSSNTKDIDSSGTLKVANTHSLKETVSIDTIIYIPGSDLDFDTEIPDSGETHTFETDQGSIAVGVDSSGNLQVKVKTKPKKVPVHFSHTKEVFDTHFSDAKTDVSRQENTKVTTTAVVDSSRHTNTVVLDKKVNRLGTWWMWGLLILAVIIFIIFKVYTRGANPLAWFTRK